MKGRNHNTGNRRLVFLLPILFCLLAVTSATADTWHSQVVDGRICWGAGSKNNQLISMWCNSLANVQSDSNDAISLTNAYSRQGSYIADKAWYSVYFGTDLPSPVAVSSVKLIVQHQGKPGQSGTLQVHVSTNRFYTQWYAAITTKDSVANSGDVFWNETEQTCTYDVTSVLNSYEKITNCEMLVINKNESSDYVYYDYMALEVTYAMISPPVMTIAAGATNVQAGSAVLNGEVVAGGPDPATWIYWGTNDGGTVSSAWNRVESLGTRAVGTFSRTVSNLVANRTYYYRTYGTNVHGTDWSDSVAIFTARAPNVAFAAASSSGSESVTTVPLTVSLSVTSDLPVTVYCAVTGGTATNLTDYSLAQGSIVIPAGSVTGAVTIAVTNDTLDETDETVIITITNVLNGYLVAPTSHTYTILDDDPAPTVSFYGAPYTVFENGTNATISVSLSSPSAKQVTIAYGTATNTATEGSDYTNTTGSFTWNPGESGAKTFTVPIVNDGASEGVETFYVLLSNAVNCTVGIGTATVSIIDDDMGAPVVNNAPGPAVVSSNSATMQGTILSVGGASTDIRIYWGPTDGGSNKTSWSNSIFVGSFGAVGQFSTNKTGLPKNTVIYYRCYSANMYGEGWADFTTNFLTGPPTIQFAASVSSSNESVSPALLELRLSSPPVYGVNVSVQYSVKGGTASNGTDYTLAAGTATVYAGQTGTNIAIAVTNDDIDETDETIFVVLSNAVGAVLGTQSNHTYTIIDDDPPPSVMFTNTPFSAYENGTNAQVTVIMDRASVWTVSVSYATADGTALAGTHYTNTTGTFTWLPGQTGTRNFNVPLIDNILKDGDKWFSVTLFGISNAAYSGNSTTNVLIKENDYDKPLVTNDGNASNVMWTAATLNGWMSEAFPAATSYIFWGRTDGGTNFASWSNSVEMGTTPGLFSLKLEGLLSGTTYYYRCYATNMVGEDWADYTAVFTMRPPAIAGVSNYYVNDDSTDGDLYCASTGSVSNAGTNRSAPKASVQAVLDQYDLAPGDVIWVDAGNYSISTPVTITNNDFGAAGNCVVIRGVTGERGSVLNGASANDVIYLKASGNVGMRFESLRTTGGKNGMYILGYSTSYCAGVEIENCVAYSNNINNFGLYVRYSENPKLNNNICFKNGSSSINMDHCNGGIVAGNTVFSNAYYGIRVLYSTNMIVTGNEVSGHNYSSGYGIVFGSGQGGTISSNSCHDNQNGIYADNPNCEISFNTCIGNTVDGINTPANNVLVRGNTCGWNMGNGINAATESAPQTIRNNVLYSNAWQLYVSGLNAIGLIENNTLYGGCGFMVRNPASLTNRSNIMWCEGLDNIAVKIETDLSSASAFPSDYNNLFITNSAILGDIAGAALPGLSDWQDGSGCDSNSICLDPLFVNAEAADFHIKSPAGSWNNGTWRNDAFLSPSVDRGDPRMPFSSEPAYNGLTVNQGAYGNTPQASKTPYSGSFYTINISTQPVAAGYVTIWPVASQYPTNRLVTLRAVSTNEGYMWNTWTGSVNTTSNPFSFYVPSNMWFTAVFATQTWTITASAGAGGQIAPSGAVTVIQASDQTFNITPDPHFFISNVVTDGSSRGATNSWTFINVRTNHTITASFQAIIWDITASAGSGGQISPQGVVNVPDGSNQTFDITADSGYSISNVVVDSVSRGVTNSWTFTNVSATHTIAAYFITNAAPAQFTLKGTPYSWLQSYGYSGDLDAADLTDDDNDGAFAWEEFQAGTSPLNSTSVFEVISVDRRALSNRITWYGTTNSGVYTYFHVYRATNMRTAGWSIVGSNLSRHATGTNFWWDTNLPSVGFPFFYKMGLTPTNQ